MDIINRINNSRFLGREFLMWLWFRSQTNEGMFSLSDSDSPRTARVALEEQLEIWFDKKVKLTSTAGSATEESSTIKADNPTETSEARVSALTGKQITDATLRVVRGQKQWTVTVKADTLGISGVKVPALLSKEDDDQFTERMALIEEIEEIIRSLFLSFVTLRIGPDWPSELHEIRTWVHRAS